MANNRFLIRCKGCSGFMAWAKFYPTTGDHGVGWYTNTNNEAFNKFFEEHDPHNEMDDYGSFYDLMDENDERIKLLDWEKRKITMLDRA